MIKLFAVTGFVVFCLALAVAILALQAWILMLILGALASVFIAPGLAISFGSSFVVTLATYILGGIVSRILGR